MITTKAPPILLLEDNELDIIKMKMILKGMDIGNEIITAKNGNEALELLRGTGGPLSVMPRPTLILLDLEMPGMGGIEFLKKLRKEKSLSTIPVFVFSNSVYGENRKLAFDLNVSGFISKPFSADEMLIKFSALTKYWKLCNYV